MLSCLLHKFLLLFRGNCITLCLLVTSWSLKFVRGVASVSVCGTAYSYSMHAFHFAVVCGIELLSPTSHSCRLCDWLVLGEFLVDLVLDE